MTKAEKIGIIVSTAALAVSIISPIATFLWLDPKIKEFNDRGRLQVTGEFTKYKMSTLIPNQRVVDLDSSYQANLLNIGKMPAKEIQIVVQYNENPPTGDFFTFEPHCNMRSAMWGTNSLLL